MIRYEYVQTQHYDPYFLLDLLNQARSVATGAVFRAALSSALAVPPDSVRMKQIEQYRCTSVVDAVFVSADSRLTNRMGAVAFKLLERELTNKFSGLTMQLVAEKMRTR